MKKFCKALKKIAMKIINAPQKPMIPLTDKENEYHQTQELCHICKNSIL